MGRRKSEFEFEPLVKPKSLPEKIVPFVLSGLGTFVVVGATVMFAFGESGLQIYLIFCGLLAVIGMIFLLVRGGADIALRATESSARVFMQADIVDAYTDNVRVNGARQRPLLSEPPTSTQQALPAQSTAITGTPIELPKPSESVLKF